MHRMLAPLPNTHTNTPTSAVGIALLIAESEFPELPGVVEFMVDTTLGFFFETIYSTNIM